MIDVLRLDVVYSHDMNEKYADFLVCSFGSEKLLVLSDAVSIRLSYLRPEFLQQKQILCSLPVFQRSYYKYTRDCFLFRSLREVLVDGKIKTYYA